LALLFLAACPALAEDAERISYNRDIRPILSDKCFSCHGPDNQHRSAELRLDVTEDGEDYFGAYLAIEPGDVEASDLVERIYSKDKKLVMPPPKSHLVLSDEEKKLLVKWIEEGATYETHWSFVPPSKPELPKVKNEDWARNAIDAFVLKKLEANDLKPSAEANKATQLRRLTLDLTGLPPTTKELDAFLADKSTDAYEKVVDRLLASSHFGERMALTWLDAARYADTNGFSIDDHREMWLWREWVIDAYNKNMPYDRFVVEQLAGDLLPEATDTTRLATGFLRNAMNTHEGGTIAEEYRVTAIADKINTVSTVFMGLTMQCAQCHDHKYDPLSQQEYYQMFAFFDTADIRGYGATNANTAPLIRASGQLTSDEQYQADVKHRIATLKRYLIHPPEVVESRAKWEASAKANAGGELAAALAVSPMERSDAQWGVINEAFGKTTKLWGRHQNTIKREIAILEADLKAGRASVMVMKEQGAKQTYVLTRGDYSSPDKNQPVSAGVPSVLPPLGELAPSEGPPTRLSLARWLVEPEHPLTARVAVNRLWQMFVGQGLVTTPNDFGMQGAYPSHRGLLDYLAADFVESGWDTKHMVKKIVMSATYRQSSKAPRELYQQDPGNTLLARASRYRLPAEIVRDNALAIAGKLDTRVGGPSVYPSQPHGLWREVSHFGYPRAFTAQAFYPSDEAGQNRRSMYTFWKRTSPPPSLTAFDAPSREVCTVDRARTNTPLQALVLLNDPEYVDAARALAELALASGHEQPNAQISYMFQRATGRNPSPPEADALWQHYSNATVRFVKDTRAAIDLVGEDDAPLAALSSVATVILNLDEVITRE
jgi:hypothetical protein